MIELRVYNIDTILGSMSYTIEREILCGLSKRKINLHFRLNLISICMSHSDFET